MSKQQKVILIDGDVVSYRAACSPIREFAGNEWSGEWVKRPPTEQEANDKLDELIEEILEGVTGWFTSETPYEVFITGKGNFRYDVAVTAPYKGNRTNLEKPEWLSSVRDGLRDRWGAITSVDEEADDLLAIRATELGPEGFVLASTDKDMLQIPGEHYNITKKEKTTVSPWEGLKFFYSQIITGDRADNIIGIMGIGPKKVEKILADCNTEAELYETCLATYQEVEGLDRDAAILRVLENGTLAWLRRFPNQMWFPLWSDK